MEHRFIITYILLLEM